jgi:exodeoxyribonuclease V gamma subunit
VATALTAVLDDPAHGGVPSGFVTFTSMASLRGLPFDVICAIGLDDAAFPSIVPPSEFDLMAVAPRRGDRQRRDADRNVFLDLLLAARRRFYVSYVGRGMRDNAPLPPAAPVAELIDYVATALDATPADAQARIVVTHPMQPFGEAAFVPGSDLRQRSFDADYCAARRSTLVARVGRSTAPVPPTGDGGGRAADEDEDAIDEEDTRAAEPVAPFFVAPLAPPEPAWRDIPLARLLSFYRNPSRFLLTQRLAIALPWDDDPVSDYEPFLVDGRARRALAERLLDAFLAGRPRDEVRALACAGLEYPPGRLGDLLRDRELAQIEAFADSIARDSALRPLPPSAHDIVLTGDATPWRIRGNLADLRSTGLLRHRYRDTHASDYVSGWIEHLFVNAVQPPGVTPQTIWHSRNGTFRLAPLPSRDDAHATLAQLGAFYARGLQSPLRFFPRASWALATKGPFAARTEWAGGVFPDRDDPAVALAFRGIPDALDDEFEATARALLDPLLARLDDPRVVK